MVFLNNIIAFPAAVTVRLLEHISWHGLGVRVLESIFILFVTYLLHDNIQNIDCT